MTTPKSSHDYHTECTQRTRNSFSAHAIAKRDGDGRRYLLERKKDSHLWAEVLVLSGGRLMVHGDFEHVLFACYGESRDPFDTIGWMGAHPDADSYVAEKATCGTGERLVRTTDEAVFLADLERLRAELEKDFSERFGADEALKDAEDEDDRAEYTRQQQALSRLRVTAEGWVGQHISAAQAASTAESLSKDPLFAWRGKTELQRDLEAIAHHLTRVRSLDRMREGIRRGEHIERLLRDAYEGAAWEGYDDTLFSLGRVIDHRVYFAHAVLHRLWSLLCDERLAASGAVGTTAPIDAGAAL